MWKLTTVHTGHGHSLATSVFQYKYYFIRNNNFKTFTVRSNIFTFYPFRTIKRHIPVTAQMASGMCTSENPSNTSGTHSIAYVTAPDEQVAKKLAQGIISGKLAACVSILPGITSIYEWENNIREDPEVLMMIKTRTSKIPKLTEFIKQNHPYDLCEVISTVIQGGNAAYLKWIDELVPEND